MIDGNIPQCKDFGWWGSQTEGLERYAILIRKGRSTVCLMKTWQHRFHLLPLSLLNYSERLSWKQLYVMRLPNLINGKSASEIRVSSSDSSAFNLPRS